MKGLFKVFFKKLFDKIEKPHYIYLDDYVVFSNDVPSLQYLIDAFEDKKLLRKNEKYHAFFNKFDKSANIYACINTANFWEYSIKDLKPSARDSIAKNQAILSQFPYIGMQLYPADKVYKTTIYTQTE